MTRLVALDTETTGLDPDTEDVFEVAIVDIERPEDGQWVWRFEPRPEVVAAMHPKALAVNRYHERIAEPGWRWAPASSLEVIYNALDGAHIVGAVPDFDTRHLTSLYRRFGMEPPRWHYHLIDVEAMAVGWLVARAGETHRQSDGIARHVQRAQTMRDVATTLPWRSDDLSRACNVEPPSDDERHTALGDARWVARWYRKLTGVGP